MSGRTIRRRHFTVDPPATLAAIETGSGNPLLLVHGSVGDMTEFRRLVVELGERYRAIAISRRFHPPNEPPAGEDQYRMDRQADDLVQVLRQTGSAHVVGISWGGYAALTAALGDPGCFRSLVLAEPPILPLLARSAAGRIHLDAFVASAIRPAAAAFRAGDGELGMALFMDGILGRPGSFEAIPRPVRKELSRFVPELALELTTALDVYMPELPSDKLRALRVPVLLLEGGRSPAMFGLIQDALSELLPHVVRERIPDAGHAIHLSSPARFTDCVDAFVRSVEGAARSQPEP